MVRRLKEGEQRLWADMMREVRPLRGRAPLDPPPAPPAAAVAPVLPLPAPTQPTARTPKRPPGPRMSLEIGTRQPGLDDTSWRGLSTGRMRAERRLDLHGQVAQAAFVLLHAFLLRAQSERLRCVEIITGTGSGPEGGILRRELPHWLGRPDLRHLVLAAVHPQAGARGANAGSVRVLLRRRPLERTTP